MAFMDALLGSTAPGESPDLKAFLGPIMEAMAAEAKRASDPIARIGDVGSAVLGTVGAGTPYAQNLAALDKQRSDTIKGGAGLFLSMLGQERQLKQLENEAAYRTETLKQGERRLAIDEKKLSQNQWRPVTITTPSGATKIMMFNDNSGEMRESVPTAPRASAPAATPTAKEAGAPTYLAQLDDEGLQLLEAEVNKDPTFKTMSPAQQAQMREGIAREIFRARRGSTEQRTETGEITTPPKAGELPPQHLTGKALIDWLAKSPDYGPQYARNVQAVGDFDSKIPAMYGRKPEVATHLKGLVSQYNPDWQEDQFDRRRQAQKAFEPGGQAYNNITNIRQIFPHLDTLTKAVDALKNGDFRVLNAASAAARKQVGAPEVTNMEQAARVVGLEAMRVFRQVGASEAEAQDFAKTLSTAASPEQLAGVIGQLHEQLSARLKSHAEAYKQATISPSRPGGRPFDMLPGELGQAEKRVSEWVKTRTGVELTQEQMSDPSQRVKGTVYKTPRGPMLWDGDGWVKRR